MLIRKWMLSAALLWLLIPSLLTGQVRKACPGGVTLKANAAVSVQGSLLLAEVLGPKTLPVFSSEWDGQANPLWREDEKSAISHGLLGIDLEKPPGRYEWKVSWPGAQGDVLTCSVFITVQRAQFPTERLKVEKQFVQPDPEQTKRAEEDQKKMRAIYDTVTPERLWDGKFRLPLKEKSKGGNFGRRRILNGEARSPHAGVDFPAPSGTPVFASQAGRVCSCGTAVLFRKYCGDRSWLRDLYPLRAFLGNRRAYRRHRGGGGGDRQSGGDRRVTGPHLHWGLTINHARVNAMDIAERQP